MGRRAGDTASHSDFPNSLQKYPTVQFMPQKLIFYSHQMSRVKGAAVMGFQWRGWGGGAWNDGGGQRADPPKPPAVRGARA